MASRAVGNVNDILSLRPLCQSLLSLLHTFSDVFLASSPDFRLLAPSFEKQTSRPTDTATIGRRLGRELFL